MKITAINSTDRDWTRYLLAFGAYGETVLMVWANGLESAIEECGDYFYRTGKTGYFCDDTVKEEYDRAYQLALIEHDEEKAREIAYEQAEQDTISVDGGHYFLSWEVQLISEDPDRGTILEMTGNPEKARLTRVAKAKRTGRPFPKHKSSKLLLTSVVHGAKVGE
jgi:hypothetical protein